MHNRGVSIRMKIVRYENTSHAIDRTMEKLALFRTFLNVPFYLVDRAIPHILVLLADNRSNFKCDVKLMFDLSRQLLVDEKI